MAKRVPLEEAASAAEVREALRGLSDQQSLQIQKFVRFLCRKLNETPDELLDLTMTSINNPERGRRWRKATVPFMAFVIQCLKGEASNLYVKRKRQPKLDLSKSAQGRLKLEPANVRPSGEELHERELIERLSSYFSDDPDVLALIGGISEGLKRAQFLEKGMAANEYASAMARFKRGASRLIEQENLAR